MFDNEMFGMFGAMLIFRLPEKSIREFLLSPKCFRLGIKVHLCAGFNRFWRPQIETE